MKILEPATEEINGIRKKGLRPVSVGVFIFDKKVYLFFDKKYKLWQFPQGGIENNESGKDGLAREMIEELGQDFWNKKEKIVFLCQQELRFDQKIWDSRELKSDQGEKIVMQGKCYLIYAVFTIAQNIDIMQTQFDNYEILSYNEALERTKEVYQTGKRKIMEKILEELKNKEFIE